MYGEKGTNNMKSKKLLALFLALLCCVLAFAGCSKEQADQTEDGNGERETLVVGITDFQPMDYQEDGEWVGFDADMARAFAESLDMDVEFIEINWDRKVMELESGAIDCVWNGMTLNDETLSAMDCSNPYCRNTQVVVMPEEIADQYKDTDSLKDLTFAVEAGSAGEAEAKKLGLNVTAVDTQARALMEVSAGTSDACVIDMLMAGSMTGADTSYPDLVHTIILNEEEGETYGVGFKKGSDLTEKLNEFFVEAYENGTMQETAEKYGIADALIPQTDDTQETTSATQATEQTQESDATQASETSAA